MASSTSKLRKLDSHSLEIEQTENIDSNNSLEKIFCFQIALLFIDAILVVSFHFLYEQLLLSTFYGSNGSGRWFGILTNASILINIVLYSIISLHLILIVISFLVYKSK